MKFQKGDIVLTVNPMFLGKAINFVSKIRSKDHKSKYTHALIITSESGATFESKWTISRGHIDDYKGKEMVVYRNIYMNEDRFQEGFRAIRKFEGKIYPFHRMFYFMIPFAARFIHILKSPVCSELAIKFLFEAGFRLLKYIYGTTPDDLDDEMRQHENYIKPFEGAR